MKVTIKGFAEGLKCMHMTYKPFIWNTAESGDMHKGLHSAGFALNEKILARNNANKAAGHGLPGARRDPRVKSYALMRANGRCQLCGTEVDALDICKPLNLVCHHEPPLEEGGWDDKMHTAALCPNCNARRHDERCLSQQMGYSEVIAQNIVLSEELFRAGLSVSDKKGL